MGSSIKDTTSIEWGKMRETAKNNLQKQNHLSESAWITNASIRH